MGVPELARKVGLAPTTIYDLEREISRTTTKLHRIAVVLGVNVAWLETSAGRRLLAAEVASRDVAEMALLYGEEWPFTFSRSRWDRLSHDQRSTIEAAVEGLIVKFEKRQRPPGASKSKTG